MLTPETTNAAIQFLVQAGSLAASELGQRWKLRRVKDNTSVPLDDKHSVETEGKIILEDFTNITDTQVKETLELVNEKQSLILNWKRGKIAAERDFDNGRVTSFIRDNQVQDFKNRIKSMMVEIEQDLTAIGLAIEKEDI